MQSTRMLTFRRRYSHRECLDGSLAFVIFVRLDIILLLLLVLGVRYHQTRNSQLAFKVEKAAFAMSEKSVLPDPLTDSSRLVSFLRFVNKFISWCVVSSRSQITDSFTRGRRAYARKCWHCTPNCKSATNQRRKEDQRKDDECFSQPTLPLMQASHFLQ